MAMCFIRFVTFSVFTFLCCFFLPLILFDIFPCSALCSLFRCVCSQGFVLWALDGHSSWLVSENRHTQKINTTGEQLTGLMWRSTKPVENHKGIRLSGTDRKWNTQRGGGAKETGVRGSEWKREVTKVYEDQLNNGTNTISYRFQGFINRGQQPSFPLAGSESMLSFLFIVPQSPVGIWTYYDIWWIQAAILLLSLISNPASV